MECKPFGEVIIALGSPITFGESSAAIVAEMNHRARKAFGKHGRLLCAPSPIKDRIKLQQTLIRGAALWGGAILAHHRRHSESHKYYPAAANPAHDESESSTRRTMGGLARQNDEGGQSCFCTNPKSPAGAHFSCSTHGTCTVTWPALKKGGDPCSRGKTSLGGRQRKPSRAEKGTRMSSSTHSRTRKGRWWLWRGWGGRHAHATFSFGGELGGKFVARYDVPWATGKQGSLANLTPNSTEGGRRHAPANETAMLIA